MTNEERTQSEITARFMEIFNSSWSTSALAGMALGWCETSDAIIAGTAAPAKPIWNHISSDETSARAFYASLDTEALREMACDALASSGWTLRAINYKKS